MEKVVRNYKLGEEPKGYIYWLTKTPIERLQALEYLRQTAYGDILEQRLQRVYRIVKQK